MDGMVLSYIPAGIFLMGSNVGDENEQPVHIVTLDAFWMDQTEVTNGMYAICVADGGCSPREIDRLLHAQQLLQGCRLCRLPDDLCALVSGTGLLYLGGEAAAN